MKNRGRLYYFWAPSYSEFLDVETIVSPDLDETIANPWALTYKDRVDWCVAALDAGDVDAVVAPMASAWSLVLDDCKHLSLIHI